ncbi:hypothetical protein [Desulfoplanes sp.]
MHALRIILVSIFVTCLAAGSIDAEEYEYIIQESHRIELPDTTGWEYLGEFDVDYIDQIPGKETVLKGYAQGDIQVVIAYLKGKEDPWSFWNGRTSTQETFDTYIDANNDRIFEMYIPNGETDLEPEMDAWGFD